MPVSKINYKYIYGPVNSWRLGSSLGVDVFSKGKKTCTFDCVYCQLGRKTPCEKTFTLQAPLKSIIDEIKSLPDIRIDYISFSGTGEPTLADNLGSVIKAIRRLRSEKIAVFTNSSLLGRKKTREAIVTADLVEVKIDCNSDRLLQSINKPSKGITFNSIISGIRSFRKEYKGVLSLQIMFVKENIGFAKGIADTARSIGADLIHINTPLRPSGCRPLSCKELKSVEPYFKGLRFSTAYDADKKTSVRPISTEDTLIRRGKV